MGMSCSGRTKKFNPSPRSNNRCPSNVRLAPGNRRSEVRFGGGSDFGFHKPSTFFDLPAVRSESHTTGFGIRSVSVIDGKGHRKSCYASSTNRYINKGDGGLIIPWSQVRVLAGPPSSYNSWRYGILRPGDHSPLVCPIERRLDGAFRGVFDEGQYLNRADSTEVTG